MEPITLANSPITYFISRTGQAEWVLFLLFSFHFSVKVIDVISPKAGQRAYCVWIAIGKILCQNRPQRGCAAGV